MLKLKSGLMLVAVALTSVTTFSGCLMLDFAGGEKGSGVAASEERVFDEFKSVSMSGAATVTIQCGLDEHEATLTVDDNLLDNITTEVEGATLEIGSSESYSTKLGLNIDVSTNTVETVSCSGACTTTILDVQTDELVLKISGAGKLVVTGNVESVDLDVSGAAKIDLKGLVAKSAKIDMSGASKATVNASESLDVDISGVGKVSYLGDPKVTKDLSGLGKVSKIEADE